MFIIVLPTHLVYIFTNFLGLKTPIIIIIICFSHCLKCPNGKLNVGLFMLVVIPDNQPLGFVFKLFILAVFLKYGIFVFLSVQCDICVRICLFLSLKSANHVCFCRNRSM